MFNSRNETLEDNVHVEVQLVPVEKRGGKGKKRKGAMMINAFFHIVNVSNFLLVKSEHCFSTEKCYRSRYYISTAGVKLIFKSL